MHQIFIDFKKAYDLIWRDGNEPSGSIKWGEILV